MSRKKGADAAGGSEKTAFEVPELVLDHHRDSIVGQMREWISRHELPPVLLMTGLRGVGKRTICRFLARWMLCETLGFSAGALEACGDCRSCKQMDTGGDTVNFTEIRSEDSEDGNAGALKIDQFRDLKSQAGFSGRRVILIPDADRMTIQAANSVLKLLEEPPQGWVMILTASDPTLVLPTVLSRCQSLRLRPFSRQQLAQLLYDSGIERDRVQVCSELAQGSWGKAIELSGEENWKQRTLLLDLLQDPGSAVNALVDWASQNDRNFDLLVNQLEHLAADLIRWSVSTGQAPVAGTGGSGFAWLNSDSARSLETHARRVSQALGGPAAARGFWVARAERLAKARLEARAPLNRKLLLQDILLPWLWA